MSMVILRIVILLWLVVCAVFDLRWREVPDGLTLPAVVLAFGWRLLHPGGWLPWALAGVMVILTLAGVLPGGDMKGLVAMALFDPRLYLLAWLGAGVVYLLWRISRRERRMPGYVGFVVGAVGWWMWGLWWERWGGGCGLSAPYGVLSALDAFLTSAEARLRFHRIGCPAEGAQC